MLTKESFVEWKEKRQILYLRRLATVLCISSKKLFINEELIISYHIKGC
jgi:hypothetical protein